MAEMLTFPMRPKSGADFCTSPLQRDGRFAAEPKINGIRFFANLRTLQVWNRHGATMTDGDRFREQLVTISKRLLPLGIEWIDCESWGRYSGQTVNLFIIDFAAPYGDARHEWTYQQRRSLLSAYFESWDGESLPGVALMPSCDPVTMWNQMLTLSAIPGNEKLIEGIVLKRKDSIYELQRTSETRDTAKWFKFRFSNSIRNPV